MSRDVIDNCCQPFYTTKGAKGTGLGLSMVDGIVRRHNGALEIESEPGEGTVVRIMIPYEVAHLFDQDNLAGNSAVVSPLSIMLVDDDEIVLKVTGLMLMSDEHKVITFSSGQDALDFLANSPDKIDVLISDRAMPGMNGDKVLAEARRINPDIMTCLLTGFADIMQEQGDIPSDADAIIGKPASLQELRRVLAELVNK
jgi:CheY-like chemotaxis protein